ncbi:MAG: hypothetical protein GQ525_15865 [Draconibacterium sp.]|nr:hypothetical protein [Draconibacterium sp.]
MEEMLITAVVFFAMYHIVKLISDHLLRRKLIKAEQYERVGILEAPKPTNDEVNKYPSLKWGLVAFMSGLGFIVIDLLKLFNKDWIDGRNAVLPIGILFVFVALGFLIYFFYMNGKKK